MIDAQNGDQGAHNEMNMCTSLIRHDLLKSQKLTARGPLAKTTSMLTGLAMFY